MERVGSMAEGEWSNYNGMYSTTEDADFMAQLLGNCSLPSETLPHGSNVAWPAVQELNMNMDMAAMAADESSMYSSDDNAAIIMYTCFSQNTIYSYNSSHDGYYQLNDDSRRVFMTNNGSVSMDYGMVEAKNTEYLMEEDDFLNQDASNDSMESNENLTQSVLHGTSLQLGRDHQPESSTEEKISSPSDMSKKRSRVLDDVQKNKRNVKPRRNQRGAAASLSSGNDEEEQKIIFQRQNSLRSCCSEDDSNGGMASTSSTKGAGALNSSGKTRASRGSATDPQSLYARKRREKINERLRILQNLVPNGTKVDISTMLEEAVQYVKFLQLQIKLLSSDDLWMYAPIAYNGMDIGLDLKIATSKSL